MFVLEREMSLLERDVCIREREMSVLEWDVCIGEMPGGKYSYF